MARGQTEEATKRFKRFLRKHPEIITHVRTHKISWKNVYEDWLIFGESGDVWEKYGVVIKKDEKPVRRSFSWDQIVSAVDHVDTKQWQERLDTLSGALDGLRTLIGEFRQTGESGENRPTERPPHDSRRD